VSFIENCKLGKKNIVSDFMSKQRGNLPLKNLAKCIFDVDVVVELPEN
jgi:hypothetical protein